MKPLLLTITIIAGIFSLSHAQSVRAIVSQDSVLIGDTFQYIITAQYPSGRYQVTFPDSTAFGGDIEFKSVQRFRGATSRDSVVYTLQFFALNDTLLSPKQVLFVQGDESVRVSTPAIPLYFRSVLSSDTAELRPLKPLFDFARSWLGILLLATLLILLAAMLYRYRDRFMSKEQEPESEPITVEPFQNPLRELQREILALQQIASFQEDQFRTFYTQISIAFRRYFEDVYETPALESTTREVIRDLKRAGSDELVISTLQGILRECDLVKFARYKPDVHQASKSYAHAEQLLRALRKFDESRIERLKITYEIRHGLRDPENPAKNKRVVTPLITSKDPL